MKISSVVENNLCISCGICAGVCPKKCISSTFEAGSYKPTIDEKSCVNCGLCHKVCPGKSADYVTPYKDKIPNIFFGRFKKCLAAQIKDKELLAQTTSGGVLTKLIENLLRDKIYDAAFLVDTYNYDEEIFTNLYTSESDFTNTPKSRYLTVNQSRAVRYMLENRDKKLILVGTSCFIQGVLNVIAQFKLNRKNYFLAGLFCDKTMNYNVWNYFKAFDKIDKLFFRTKEAKGWPGVVGVEKKGKKIFLPRELRLRMKDFFCVERCRYCLDKLNQFADISFGDNYCKTPLPKEMDSKAGTSCLIMRTNLGLKIFEKYIDEFLVAELPAQEIYKTQKIEKRKTNFVFGEYKSAEVGYSINRVPSEISLADCEKPTHNREYESLLVQQKMGCTDAFPAVAVDVWHKINPKLQKLMP